MKKTSRFLVTSLSVFFLVAPPVFAAWVWSPEAGKFINPDVAVQDTPEEQYDYAMTFYKEGDLKKAADELRLLLKSYPGSRVAPEGQYRLGAIYEEMGDYYKAFQAYRNLLERYPQSERMSEAIEREFRIGNVFLSGERAKVMGLKILPSEPRAVEIFKHIVETAPYSEYGDRAQFHLGLAHKKGNHFDEAIEAFKGLIDQYPQSEFVPQARFQIADASYLQSVVADRDQRVIDRAATEIDQFLRRHPDSSVSDKAARLRQEIDEKNAEKNYRVGLFYEKENFIESAFIYYRDVAQRYPHTGWGAKAKERLLALEKPAEYLSAQETEILSEKQRLRGELEAVGESDPARKKELKWELDRLEKEEKELRKAKPETLKRRRSALRQKERELNEKRKALEKKKKRFAKGPSEDLTEAFDRWEASLKKEEAELARERARIEEWEQSLGVETTPFYSRFVPFGKETPSPLEQVRVVEMERLAELAREKAELLREKEMLYREYEKFATLEGLAQEEDQALEADREGVEAQAREIEDLKKTVREKEEFYEQHFGTSPWQALWRVPTKVVATSVGILNPFGGGDEEDWKFKSVEELQALQSHWQEKVAAQSTLVDTIGQVFNDELAGAEEERIFATAEEEETDPRSLRRSIKQLEREIRSRYNEIQDRNARKNEILEELEGVFKAREEEQEGLAKGGRFITVPVTGLYKFGRAFLLGLPERDVRLTQEAQGVTAEEIDRAVVHDLQKEIELESLLIQARNEEIQKLERELEALRARASFSGAPAFRSLLIKFPYVFVREAIASASRLVPREDREEKLIEQLNRESGKLEELKKELGRIESLIGERTGEPAPTAPAVPPVEEKPDLAEAEPNQDALQGEIETLQKQLEFQTKNYEHELEQFEKMRWERLSGARGKARARRMKGIEEDLIELIEKEQRIHQKESELLGKKKDVVEQFLGELPADLFSEELNFEKDEIEARLNEIRRRETTLIGELRRFRPQAYPPT